LKIFTEFLDIKEELGWVIDESKTKEYKLGSMSEKIEKAKDFVKANRDALTTKQLLRIHLCTHDEPKNSPCEIING